MKNNDNVLLPDLKKAAKRNKKEVAFKSFSLDDKYLHIGEGLTYYINTYGCQANVRDSETIAGLLELMSFRKGENMYDSDLVIFNTCAIRANAEDHVFGNIGELKAIKEANPKKIISVCGCMVQETATVEKILNSYPTVDLIFGTHNIDRLPVLLYEYMQNRKRLIEVYSEEGDVIENLPVKRNDPYKGFVDIMYGCDKFCTYCIVPYTRGKERSRKMEDILKEVNELKENGYKEVILLGQNVNAYGKDLGMEDGFAALLEEVAKTNIERIRFYTSHPRDYTFSTITMMKKYPNIMNSLHLPVQSGSNDVLRRMNRGYTQEAFKKLVDDMKREIPTITFTTDLIVGFPNETEEDFNKTLELVDYCQFDSAFTFIYSPRIGTPASRFEDKITVEEKRDRLAKLNERISYWAYHNNEPYLNKTVKVLCEGPSKKNPDVYCGYSEENKLVNFTGPKGLEGKIVEVKITEIKSFSLQGVAL